MSKAQAKAQAKAIWMAALRWYQDETDDFSQDRLRRAGGAFEAWFRQRSAEKAFEAWWKEPIK